MELSWADIVIDKSGVQAEPAFLMEEWVWLAPQNAEPMLPTACGDLFLSLPDGSIAFLDTYAGSCAVVAPNYDSWKAMLNDPNSLERWFRVALVGELLDAGLTREPGQCFSPLVPQIVGGSWESSNFDICDLVVHLAMLGQIHQQVKDLPPGTKISGIKMVDE